MHIATFSYCALAYQVPFNDINSAHHQNWNKIQLWYSVFVFVIHLKSPPLLLEKALVSNQIQPCMYKSFVNITVISLKYQFLKYQFFVAHHNQVGVSFDVYFLCCSIPVQTIFEAHPNGCAAIAMSPDAKYIATISSTLPQVIIKPTCPKWITKCNFGKISAQPPLTVVKQSLSIKSNLLLLPLFSFS